MNIAARLTGSSSDWDASIKLVTLRILPAGDVAALPLVLLGGGLPGDELEHVQRGIRLRHGRRVHLEVGVELRVGVRIGHVGREEDRGRHRLQFDVDAGFLGGLLDDRLRLLARLVDRGLIDELQLLAVLGTNAIGPLLPAGLLENVVRLVDIELDRIVLRAKRSGL